MKKLLVFLALFGAGLLVLHWLSRGEPAPEVLEPPDREPAELPPPAPGSEEPPRPQGMGLTIGGSFRHTYYDPPTGRAILKLRSEDSRTLQIQSSEGSPHVQGLDEFLRLRAEVIATDGTGTQARLEAGSGRIARLPRPPPAPAPAGEESSGAPPSGPELMLDWERRVDLGAVAVEVLQGVPLVPLRFAAPSAEIDARDELQRVIRTPDPVALDSPKLEARGTGLTVGLDAGTLVLEREARLAFRGVAADPDALARLESAGPMTLRKVGETGLTIDAEGTASLSLPGGARLAADRLSMQGHEAPAGAEGFTPESLAAEGSVVWTSGADVFRSQRASVEFDERGRPNLVRLVGLPSFVLSLGEEAVELPGVEGQPLRGSGEGPLVLSFESGVAGRWRFDLGGPATVETPGGTLRSGGAVQAWSRPDEEQLGFSAGGGVVLESDAALLETAEIVVDVTGSGEDRTLTAKASRGARLVGTRQDGHEFSLTSPDRLEVVQAATGWRVQEGTGVVLTLEGPDGFTARADRVRDFDPTVPTLLAEGNVSFESPRGGGSGARLRVLGPRRFLLDGTEAAPAQIHGPEGQLEAVHFERDGERLVASGSVKGSVVTTAGRRERYELSAGLLDVVHGEERDAASGEVVERLQLEARGAVEARWIVHDETTALECEELSGTGYERRAADDTLLEGRSELVAVGQVWSSFHLDRGWIDLNSQRLRLERGERDGEQPVYAIEANGSVRFEIQTGAAALAERLDEPGGAWVTLTGSGERLVLDHRNEGLLEPAPGGRVQVGGTLLRGTPFDLTAEELRFRAEGRLEARSPVVRVQLAEPAGDAPASSIDARAEAMVVTREFLELSGAVELLSATPSGVPWRLRAGRVRFEGLAAAGPDASLRSLRADGGIDFELGVRGVPLVEGVARARGETLEASSTLGTLRLTGAPARIESPLFFSEGDWIEFDPDLQIVTRTGRGRIRSPPEGAQEQASAEEGWRLEYLSSNTMIEPDSLVYVLQEPRFYDPGSGSTLRASWAVLWLDRRGWEELPGKLASGELSPEDLRFAGDTLLGQGRSRTPSLLFGMFETSGFAGLLRETYFEGPIEILRGDDLLARADAIFLDAVDGHGWLADATVNVYGNFVEEDFKKLIVKAEWLRHSKDGSLRASSATVTPCDFEKPHMRIVTQDLLIDPLLREGQTTRVEGYAVTLRGNRLEFYDRLKIPLGSLNFRTDEEGRPDLGSFDFGDSARFGTFVKARIVRPAGKLGKTVNDVLKGNPFDYDAHYSVDASYLGSRGVLLDLGLDIESGDDYWLNFLVGGLPDSGEDKGYIRVPEDERDRLRLWYRGRSRHMLGAKQWLDFALSHQTDAGVQSEFFEPDFERYEQSESFVHWRLADGSDYFDASVKIRTESFRTDIDELPSVGVYRGRRPLVSLGALQLVHAEDARAEYLRRHEGLPGLQSPFLLPDTFPDGQGDREVLRFDATERVELPLALGFAGLRLTPFVDGRVTLWNEGLDPDEAPSRFVAEAGTRLATTLWKRSPGGVLHQVSPFVELSDDFAYQENGDPLRFDTVDDPPGATLVDFGARGRFRVRPGADPLLDLDLRARHASGVRTGLGPPLSPDQGDGWSAAVFGELNVEPFDTPLQLTHDARYDLMEELEANTIYTTTRVGLRISEDLRFEAGHRRGYLSPQSLALDPVDPANPAQEVFEAASVSGIYSWTPKWEFESRQVISLRDDTSLANDFVLRRFGHDIIFEVELTVRESEGTSLGFRVRPLFGWRASRLGYLGN